MKKFASAATVAATLLSSVLIAPAAHAGYVAQTSSEAAQLSSNAWGEVGGNMAAAWPNNPFPSNVFDSIAAGFGGSSNAMLISAYHWTFMTINQILDLFNP